MKNNSNLVAKSKKKCVIYLVILNTDNRERSWIDFMYLSTKLIKH